MIKVEKVEYWGFEHAIRGMRNPMNSWSKSDSYYREEPSYEYGSYVIGDNDLALMKGLYKAGTEHRKYLRQIIVSMDITAPLYWWKEFDTYKVGTVANSCSTMHKITSKEFVTLDFSCEHLKDLEADMPPCHDIELVETRKVLNYTISTLNKLRKEYLTTKDKDYWYAIIQLLPSSYNQKRTITMNYENVMTMINQRYNHKLDEWNDFVDFLLELPKIADIRGEENE